MEIASDLDLERLLVEMEMGIGEGKEHTSEEATWNCVRSLLKIPRSRRKGNRVGQVKDIECYYRMLTHGVGINFVEQPVKTF